MTVRPEPLEATANAEGTTAIKAGATRPSGALAGLGNNPSTWAGVWVLGALAFLSVARKSFKRYM